jgi:hypothetical protein
MPHADFLDLNFSRKSSLLNYIRESIFFITMGFTCSYMVAATVYAEWGK